MSLSLSSRELALLGDALTVISAPLAYGNSDEWRAAVRRAIRPLLGADASPAVDPLDEPCAAAPARRVHRHSAAILALLRPAFRASVATLVTRGTPDGPRLPALVDALPAPAALCSGSGLLLHESPALTRLLAAEPCAPRIRAAIVAAARTLAAHGARAGGEPSAREVRGALECYELRGAMLVATPGAERSGLSLFLVRAAPPRALSDTELRERFALTAREVEVLRLLAVGRSAREVAEALGLSYYTARHHVEHVLVKLGVRTRAAVASATAAAALR